MGKNLVKVVFQHDVRKTKKLHARDADPSSSVSPDKAVHTDALPIELARVLHSSHHGFILYRFKFHSPEHRTPVSFC